MNIAESFMTFMERGGLVMWPLLGLSVITLAITIERTAFWFRVHGRTGRTSYRALTSAISYSVKEAVVFGILAPGQEDLQETT